MVKVKEDLTGKKYNHLLVISQAEDYIDKKGTHSAQWLVKCDCNKSEPFIVRGSDLKNNHTKSCGCIKQRGDKVKAQKDLTGQTFGRLKVLCQADEDYVTPQGKHESKWWVICSCGKTEKFTVKYSSLISGNTKSCGCLATEARIKTGKSKKKTNTYNLSGEFGIGYTSKNEEFWFDLEDYEKIKDYCWYYSEGYLTTNITISKGKQKRLKLHRLIMDEPEGFEVDHIVHPKGEGLKYDNRKSNLRLVNKSQNQMNKHKQSNNTSGVVGVSWHKRDLCWEAHISVNKKYIYLGRFKTLDEAIDARLKAEKKYFGEYALNYSNKQEKSNEN